MNHFTARPELCGTFGAAATTHWIASACAMGILERGGNAFDAAACAGFVLQIVEPHLNGPGGDAPIIVARHDDPSPTVICGQGPAPAAASIDAFRTRGLALIPGTGLLAAVVPGAYGAWMTMLRDYGTCSVREILAPAIHYARHGHPLLARAADTIASVEDLFAREWRTSADLYLNQDKAPEAGSLFRNTALADFYDRVVDHAEASHSSRERQIDAALSYWYEGEVAETVDRFCRETAAMDVTGERHTGLLTGDDLAGWRPPVEQPLSVDQGNYELFKCGAWSQGPSLLQSVRLLDGLGVEACDPDSPDYVHLLTETIKLSMADRDAWYGDEEGLPMDTLISRGYAEGRRSLVGRSASGELRPGTVDGTAGKLPSLDYMNTLPSSQDLAGGGEPTMAQERETLAERQTGDTCHVDVVDRWGNMVSATPSGGWLQASPAIPGLGFALGTRLQMAWLEPGLPNSLAPGKRPRTTLTPSMAYRDGKPYLAFGTPGGDQQDQWSLHLWLLHTVYGRTLQAAIETPAFHTEHMIASFWPRSVNYRSLTLEARFPEATAADLRRRGHEVTIGGPWSEGRLSACAFDEGMGGTQLRAGANPRGMQGYAIVR